MQSFPTIPEATSPSSGHVAAPEYPLGAEGSVFVRSQGIAGRLQEGAPQIHLCVGGFGTTLHLSGEMMNSMAGVQVTHIPYKGAGPALTDLLGGRVDLLFDNLPGSLPSVRAGQVKPVAVTSRSRIPELPDVPAMAEVLPGYEITSWTAMIGPSNMKADLVAQVNALTVKALADPTLKARYSELGATPWPTSPAEIKAFRDSEELRLLPIMRAAGIKPE
jgi:tripartite-type tricarboxylate transporter receptor subunit TctC